MVFSLLYELLKRTDLMWKFIQDHSDIVTFTLIRSVSKDFKEMSTLQEEKRLFKKQEGSYPVVKQFVRWREYFRGTSYKLNAGLYDVRELTMERRTYYPWKAVILYGVTAPCYRDCSNRVHMIPYGIHSLTNRAHKYFKLELLKHKNGRCTHSHQKTELKEKLRRIVRNKHMKQVRISKKLHRLSTHRV
jgi:hypothetical protein